MEDSRTSRCGAIDTIRLEPSAVREAQRLGLSGAAFLAAVDRR